MRVEIGQTYRSRDRRDKGRQVKVISKCGARNWWVENILTGRRTKISVSSLVGTGARGWELVND